MTHGEGAELGRVQEGVDAGVSGVQPLAVYLLDLPYKVQDLPLTGEEGRGTGGELRMRPTEHPNGLSGPVNEHLGEHEVPTQNNDPMEEPEEAGSGARSPSPEYGGPMEAEALMEDTDPKRPEPEPEAPARSMWPRGSGAHARSTRRTTSPRRSIRAYMLYRYPRGGASFLDMDRYRLKNTKNANTKCQNKPSISA